MFEYFQSGKRKAGLVTLLMACVFASLCIRAIRLYASLGLTQDADLHPYSHITITLTLLSAWLLLSKPWMK